MSLIAKGFSLVELIIGMVLLALVCGSGVTILMSQTDAFNDPVMQQTSLQISTKIIHEIQIRSYDEKSDDLGESIRCGENLEGINFVNCSATLGFDEDENSLNTFDDVDDFITSKLCATRSDCVDDFIPSLFFYSADTEDESWKEILKDYSVKIDVTQCPITISSEGIISCNNTNSDVAKLVDIAIKQKDGNIIHYQFIKANI